jgi:hypothetical protein
MIRDNTDKERRVETSNLKSDLSPKTGQEKNRKQPAGTQNRQVEESELGKQPTQLIIEVLVYPTLVNDGKRYFCSKHMVSTNSLHINDCVCLSIKLSSQ